MKKAILLLVTALALVLSGCASQLSIQAQPMAEQEKSYAAGQPLILSQKKHSVAISQSSSSASSNEQLSFLVYLTNTQDTPTNFGPSNITASFNGQYIRVFSRREVIAQMESARQSQALSAALAGISQSMSATGQQQHSGTISSQYYGRQGYVGNSTGTYSGTTYDPAAAAVAQSNIQAQTQQNIGNINQMHNQKITNAKAVLLATETVYPGNNHGGYIRIDQLGGNSPSGKLRLTVTVDLEQHYFDFFVRSH